MWNLPGQGGWGTFRGVYAPLQTPYQEAIIVRLPSGQTGPIHKASSELVLLMLHGAMDFIVGDHRYEVEQHDLLIVPADTPFRVSNPNFEHALFFSVHDRGDDEAPYTMTYKLNDDDEGWDIPAGAEVTHMRWEDYRRQAHYRGGGSDRFGFHRGVFPFVETEHMRGHSVLVPPGQGSPWHTFPGDSIFVGLIGAIEVYSDTTVYPLGPCDVLRVVTPLYSLQNVGLENALYFSIGSKRRKGEKPVYHEPAVLGDPLAGPGPPIS
jgi:quercetin dioxygenase-like cupin family protein